VSKNNNVDVSACPERSVGKGLRGSVKAGAEKKNSEVHDMPSRNEEVAGKGDLRT
jgi:hypothetical protein